MSSTATATATQTHAAPPAAAIRANGVPDADGADWTAGHDAEQIRLMEERLILVDADDNPTGDGSKKECACAVSRDAAKGRGR